MDILDLRSWPERMMSRFEDPQSRGSRALSPLSALYRFGSTLHQLATPRRDLPCPPVSIAIGNLRVGGTGKTPVTAELVRLLRAQGVDCAVLSRGFRAEDGGDEPAWLKRETGAPVLLGRDRRRSFDEARERGVEAVVLDDAYQSQDQARWRLCIVLAKDLTQPPRVLPAGPYREPASALSRAHAILVRCEAGDPPFDRQGLANGLEGRPAFPFRMLPTEVRDSAGHPASLKEMCGWGPTLLVSGLARPESFEADAAGAGAVVALSVRFSDHASFGASEKERIEDALRSSGAGWILSTEKNLQRLIALDLAVPVWALRSELNWDDQSPGEWLGGRVNRA